MKKSVFLFFLFLFPICLNSQNPNYGIEFQLNSYSLRWEEKPEVTVLTNRNFIACWYTTDSLTYENVIYGQIFSPNGTKINSEFQLNTYSNINRKLPIASSVLPDSGFVVCWTNYTRDGDGSCVVAQIFNSNGQKKGDEFIVNTYTTGYQSCPDITYINNNRFIICWENSYPDWNIYGQIFDFDGMKIGTEFMINTNTQDNYYNPKTTNLSDSTFIVCWQKSFVELYCQKFNSNGFKLGSETQINTSFLARDQDITFTHEGFIVVWKGDINKTRLLARRFNDNVDPIGEEFQIDDFTTDWTTYPKVIQLENKNVIICWEYNTDIYCQLLDSTFSKYGINFKLNDYSNLSQRFPSIDNIPGTGFITCWESDRQQATDILGKIMPDKPSNRVLSQFDLIHPSEDSTLFYSDPTFHWYSTNKEIKPYSWEVLYSIYISEDSLFQNPIIYNNIMDTTMQINPLDIAKLYYWMILAKNISGDSIWSSNSYWTFYIDPSAVATEIKKDNSNNTIDGLAISTYPNPFNSKVNFKFSLDYNSWIEINIYNILGQSVRKYTLPSSNRGNNLVEWDGKNFSGQLVGTGIYMFSIQTKKEIKFGKLLLIK